MIFCRTQEFERCERLIEMRIPKTAMIAVCTVLALCWTSQALCAPPRWQKSSPAKDAIPGNAVRSEKQPFNEQCPTAYSGLKGDLLPTYWKAADKGQPAKFLKSQVQDRYLYCVYGISSGGRQIHVSAVRLIPEGFDCISDGAGRFECREKPGNTQPLR